MLNAPPVAPELTPTTGRRPCPKLINRAALNKAVRELTLYRQLKENTDFSVCFKDGQLHVLCGALHEGTVRETLGRHGAVVASWHSFP